MYHPCGESGGCGMKRKVKRKEEELKSMTETTSRIGRKLQVEL